MVQLVQYSLRPCPAGDVNQTPGGGKAVRIVYICDFFHPDAGYHPNLLSKYWARFGHEVYMLTSELERMPSSLTRFFDCDDIQAKDRRFAEEYGVQIIRCPIWRFVSGRSVYKGEIFRQIRLLDPDVVYVNGNDTLIGMQLTAACRRHSFGLVMDSHMLDMASHNKFKALYRLFYRKMLAPVILKNEIPVIRAQNDDYVEKHLGIPLARSPWISFGSDMLLFHPDAAVRQARRAACGIAQDAFVILYAGKINKIKGLDLFAQAIRQRFDAKREVCIVLVGSTEGAQGAQLEQALAESENRVLRFPTQKYTDLPPFYQMADLAVFPRQCSLSFFDVQACGLPVVFEDNNISVERSAAGNARVFPADDAAGLRTALEAFIAMEPAQFAVWRENAVAYIRRAYDYEEKARAYIPYLEAQARAKGRL